MDEDKAEKWKKIIEDQKASGQNASRWCEENNVSRRQFYWWKNKISDQQNVSESDQKQFVELNIPPEKNRHENPSAILKCGSLRLVIFPDTDEKILEKVIRVMMRNA